MGEQGLTDRARSAIYGHLVGDALGVPYEFTHHIETVEWRGHGTHNQPAGTWSDDGALMLATLDSLLDASFDPADQGRRFLDWRDRGAYTPNREGRFDIGGATARALDRLARGVPAEDAGDDPNALGNGSLMRILPIALADPSLETEELVTQAHRSSRVTHGAPPCLVACALYVLVARELLAGETDAPAALDRSVHRLREIYRDDAEPRAALEAHLAWPGRSGRGHVTDSFWSAWDAFAGGLAALRWGLDERGGGIPRQWLGALRGREIVEGLLRTALES